MKIGTVIFFNDGPDNLERCLKSMRPHVDVLIAADGPYVEFPHKYQYSTDGCLEVARQWCDHVIQGDIWPSQVIKRNLTIIGKPGDYFLSLDADEEFKGVLKDLSEMAYSIKMEVINQRSSHYANVASRLFQYQVGIEYRHQHSLLWVGDKLITPHHNDSMPRYSHGEIIHHRTCRPESRVIDKGVYYKNRKENQDYSNLKEQQFKEKQCLPLAV